MSDNDFVAASDQVIRERILHTLKVYPQISPTMLQVGIGTALSSKMWHPVMEKLIAEGLVKKEIRQSQGTTGRDLTYTILSLVEAPKE